MVRARCLMVMQHYQSQKNNQKNLHKVVKHRFDAISCTASMLVLFLSALMALILGLNIRFFELNF